MNARTNRPPLPNPGETTSHSTKPAHPKGYKSGQVAGYLPHAGEGANVSLREPQVDESASLLLVDDDPTFCRVLSTALSRRGFSVSVAHSVEQALPMAAAYPPEFAVVDMKMSGASGLVLVKALHELDANTRIVVLTGYASIGTAVEAIKLGATQYLSKPANANEIVAAFGHLPDGNLPLNAQPAKIEHLEWEHIQRVLREHDNNISSTARALNMHRRTLQRKLGKPPLRSE